MLIGPEDAFAGEESHLADRLVKRNRGMCPELKNEEHNSKKRKSNEYWRNMN